VWYIKAVTTAFGQHKLSLFDLRYALFGSDIISQIDDFGNSTLTMRDI